MTENAPELSGARPHTILTGREPVLKGHYSKVLADRRGAYLAHNLDALIRMMSDVQKEQLKIWAAHVTVRQAQSVVHLYESVFPSDKRPRTAIETAKLWLQDPTQLTTDQLQTIREEASDAAYAVRYSRKWTRADAALCAWAAVDSVIKDAENAAMLLWWVSYKVAAMKWAAQQGSVDASYLTAGMLAEKRAKRALLRVSSIILQRGNPL